MQWLQGKEGKWEEDDDGVSEEREDWVKVQIVIESSDGFFF